MNMVVDLFLIPISPILAILLGAVLLTVLECFPKWDLKRTKLVVALLAGVISLGCSAYLWRVGGQNFLLSEIPQTAWLLAFRVSYQLDQFALAFYMAITVFTLLSIVFLHFHFRNERVLGEVLLLTLFIATGMLLLVSANSLLILFLALELLSLPTYVLVGIHAEDRQSLEASLKYFLFGSFASVILVLAIALLYAQHGSLLLSEIADQIKIASLVLSTKNLYTYAGLVLFIVATGFKVGLVPFHMWLPDAYQGAPTAVTGFMGSAIKATGFALMARLLWSVFLPLSAQWVPLLDVLAVITMFVGNILALRQDNLKRMFAYSSIAHAGYLILAITSFNQFGPDLSILGYYLLIYGLMFLGLFAVIDVIEQQTKTSDIYHLSGVGFSHPWLGVALTLFALSGAGIPPLAGFFAKYFVFFQAVQVGKTPIVVLAVLSSLIGVYYYLRVLIYLYMKPSQERLTLPVPRLTAIGIWTCAIAMLAFAVFPF